MEKDVEKGTLKWEQAERRHLADLGDTFPLNDSQIIQGLYSAVACRLERIQADTSLRASEFVGRQRDSWLNAQANAVVILSRTKGQLEELLPKLSDDDIEHLLGD